MSISIPSITTAAVLNADTKKLDVKEIPIAAVYEDEILVETKAVSINDVDNYHIDFGWAPNGAVLGTAVSGIVLKVGANVSRFKPGDFVASFIHGGDYTSPHKGGYAKYAVVQEFYSLKFDNLKSSPISSVPTGKIEYFETACSVVNTSITLGISLFHTMGGSFDQKQDKTFLIYGGSTVSGLIAAKLAKFFGWEVISIASKKHTELIRIFGGDHLIDYHDLDVVDQVRAINKDIDIAFHTVGGVPSLQLLNDAVSDSKDVKIDSLIIPSFEDIKNAKANVQFTMTRAFTANGRDAVYNNGRVFEPKPGARESLSEFMPIIEKMWNDGSLHHIPVRIYEGGLENVNAALQLVREKKVSGEKLVLSV